MQRIAVARQSANRQTVILDHRPIEPSLFRVSQQPIKVDMTVTGIATGANFNRLKTRGLYLL